MKITMIDYTGSGTKDPVEYAENVLLFAKNTRLMRSTDFNRIKSMSGEKRTEEISYIARTIPSSWEFLHYSYVIEGVTRAFTHQLVRTRTASYAQQAMRVLPMEDFEYLTPKALHPGGKPSEISVYREAMGKIQAAYDTLIGLGVMPENARGILPTNILTNIAMSANLRTIVELVRKRSNPRVQGEYREFIEELQTAIQLVHPFTEEFFGLDWSALNRELEAVTDDLPTDKRIRVAKLFSKVTEGVTS